MIELSKDCVKIEESGEVCRLKFFGLTEDDCRKIAQEIQSDVVFELQDIDDDTFIKEMKRRFDPDDLVDVEVDDIRYSWNV